MNVKQMTEIKEGLEKQLEIALKNVDRLSGSYELITKMIKIEIKLENEKPEPEIDNIEPENISEI